ncbi:MAG: carboxypeptidase-like regulatory domain-containing protein [Janthinobacterium lividum]
MHLWVYRLSWSVAVTLSALLPTRATAQHLAATTMLPDAPGYLIWQQAPPVQEQGSGSISGLITDVNGGVVPGALIAVLVPQDGATHQVTAGPGGTFRLDALPVGIYKLRIEAAGLQPFQSPEIKLEAGQNYILPATALLIATSNQTVDVVMSQEQIANEELKEETRQRVLGLLPNFYTSYVWNAAPLTARQKYRLGFRTVIDPWVFVRTGITAGIQQANNTYPEYGNDGASYVKRYFAAYGDAVTGRIIGSAILPSIFHQDPRYFYRGTGGVPRRVLHALVSSVAARTDGGRVEPNYSTTLGNFTAGYLSRTWHPGSENGISLAVDNMLIGIGDSAARNLAQEFLFKRISRGTSPFAKGKPPEERESAAHP